MQVRALKSFAGRYGHIRMGQLFNCQPNYAAALKENGLVAFVEGREPGPEHNESIPEAPMRAAPPPPIRPPPTKGKGGATGTTERAPAGGRVRTSVSLRQDLASRKKTRKLSVSGATDPPETATQS